MKQNTLGVCSNTTKNLSEEYMDILAQEMQKEIDESVMLEMLVIGGWTKVQYSYKSREHSVDVINWIDENIKDGYKRLSDSFVFEEKKHAEWFILRWC